MVSKVHIRIKLFQVCDIIIALTKCTVDSLPPATNRYSAYQEIAFVTKIEDSSLLPQNTDTFTTYSSRYQFYYYSSTWS
jgi:hypothetical protein